MQFEWDPEKAASNHRKHGVSFEEALTVFYDRLAATFSNGVHSATESRFVTVGHSARGRLLVIYHAHRGDAIRLIGARLATDRERKNHES